MIKLTGRNGPVFINPRNVTYVETTTIPTDDNQVRIPVTRIQFTGGDYPEVKVLEDVETVAGWITDTLLIGQT